MAKNSWGDEVAQSGKDWGDKPAAQQDAPQGIKPSTAGAGRGSINPPLAGDTPVDDGTEPTYDIASGIQIGSQARQERDSRSLDQRRTRTPGRVTAADIPAMTPLSLARDAMSGALQIGPTVVKSVGDIARLATGDRLGKGMTDFADRGNRSIQEVVGSERGQAQRKMFNQDMEDPALNAVDLIVGNPGGLADMALPTLGSMALPIAAAGAATKLATGTRAAQLAGAIDPALVAARANTAREAAVLGTTVAQNAASGYSESRDAGLPQDQAYMRAAITAPFTYVAGRLTGGGAEGQVARALVGKQTTLGAVKAGVQTALKESGQEAGEAVGDYVGETVGKGEEFDLNKATKQVAVGATLGAVIGGGSGAVSAASAAREARIKQLTDAGEKDVASLLQAKHDKLTATEAVNGELETMRGNEQFQGHYRNLRTAGIKPAEAAARAAMIDAFGQVGQQAGISQKAMDAVLQKGSTLPIDKIPAFLDRYTKALAANGMAQPFDGIDSLASSLETARDDAIEAAMGAAYNQQDIRSTMSDVQALESANTTAKEQPSAQNQESIATPAPVATSALSASQAGELDAAPSSIVPANGNNAGQPDAALDPSNQLQAESIQAQAAPELIAESKSNPLTRGTDIFRKLSGIIDRTAPEADRARMYASEAKRVRDAAQVMQDSPDVAEAYNHAADVLEQRAKFYSQQNTPVTNVQNPAQTPAQPGTDAQAAPAQAPEAGALAVAGQPATGAEAGTGAVQANGVDTPAEPQRLGRNNIPLSEGGKPFSTKKAADQARKQNPMMRVVSEGKGYVLTEKTPAQLAAQEKSARRLRNANTSPSGQAIPAHAFIAAEGGLHRDTKADMGMEGNVRIGNRTLFAGKDKGLTIERATERLVEEGYLLEGASHSDAMALIKRSLTNPQYTPEGTERMAEAEAQTRFDDFAAVQQEAADNGEADPFALSNFVEPVDVENTGYSEATRKVQAEVNALVAMADSLGIDTDTIKHDAHDLTRDGTEKDYYDAAKSALQSAIEAAIARSRGDSRPDISQQSDARSAEPAPKPESVRPPAPDPAASIEAVSVSAPAFPSELKTDGTLAIKGDAKAIREALSAIPAKNLLPMKGGILVAKSQADKAAAILRGETPKLTAREAQEQGDKNRTQEKKDKAAAARAGNSKEPGGLTVGKTPSTAEPVTIKDGVIYVGKYEALDFDSAKPVQIKAGATDAEIVQALKEAGVLNNKQKVFGLQENAIDQAADSEINPERNEELIELRKRESVLKALAKCMGG